MRVGGGRRQDKDGFSDSYLSIVRGSHNNRGLKQWKDSSSSKVNSAHQCYATPSTSIGFFTLFV
jgi:hypothetical protein